MDNQVSLNLLDCIKNLKEELQQLVIVTMEEIKKLCDISESNLEFIF